MPRRSLLWLTVSSLVLLGSCVHRPCSRSYPGPQTRPAEMLEYYDYPHQDPNATVETLKQKSRYTLERVELDSSVNLFGTERIRVDYYRAARPGRHAAILVLPISGGVDFCVESFARLFASHGLHAAIVHNREVRVERIRTAEEVEDYFRQVVLDNRQVLDWLVRQPEVDPNRLGSLGLSLGGIRASLVVGVDDRIRAVVMGLAGGSFADMAVTSKEKKLRRCIERWAKSGIPREDIHKELSAKVRTDPLRLAPYIDARDALLFIAMFDRSVPRESGDRLRRAIGNPETVYLPSGHYSGFLYLPYAHAKSLAFFRKQFDLP
ncbi:MAG: prolyl oligopeptidase family serine peptidase [Phycisphaerae bacterium]|nr:prolyl oligopeptidase family serine peptidase [Phycisphaerae bacterium]